MLLARPASEPLWEAVVNSILEQYAGHEEPDRDYVARVRLMVTDSSLRGEYLKSHAMVERVLADGIADRMGADSEKEIYPRLMAAAVTAAVRVALNHWLHSDPAASLIPTLTNALKQVAAGLPEPAARGEFESSES